MCWWVSSWTRGNTNVEMLQFLFFNSKSRSPAKSSQLLCITKINISILFQIVIRSLTTLRLGSDFWTHSEASFYFRLQTKTYLDPVLTRWIIQHSRPGESDLSWFGLDDLPIKIDTFLLSILSAFKSIYNPLDQASFKLKDAFWENYPSQLPDFAPTMVYNYCCSRKVQEFLLSFKIFSKGQW